MFAIIVSFWTCLLRAIPYKRGVTSWNNFWPPPPNCRNRWHLLPKIEIGVAPLSPKLKYISTPPPIKIPTSWLSSPPNWNSLGPPPPNWNSSPLPPPLILIGFWPMTSPSTTVFFKEIPLNNLPSLGFCKKFSQFYAIWAKKNALSATRIFKYYTFFSHLQR